MVRATNRSRIYHIGLISVSREDCLLYTSDAADEARSVDLGGRRIIKNKRKNPRNISHFTDTVP
ncbi:hypothetical protein PVA38_09540 [Streptococcus pneumoniae D39]|nr:hypothetical protein PVA38_09540 [Streptococcus pneumoniae D39]